MTRNLKGRLRPQRAADHAPRGQLGVDSNRHRPVKGLVIIFRIHCLTTYTRKNRAGLDSIGSCARPANFGMYASQATSILLM